MNRTERLPATVKSADKTAGLGVPASARAGVRCSCAELSSAHFAAFKRNYVAGAEVGDGMTPWPEHSVKLTLCICVYACCL